MKVLHVSQNEDVLGGSDVYFRFITEELSSKNIKIKTLTAGHEDTSNFTIKKVNFDNPSIIDIFEYCYNRRARRSLENIIAEFLPDVIHLHIYYGQITSSIFSVIKKYNVPVVQTLHEYKIVCPAYTMYRNDKQCYSCKNNRFFNALRYNCKGSWAKSLLSMTESYISLLLGSQKHVDKFITVSSYQRNELIKMGLSKRKTQVLHNSISFDDFKFDLNFERKGLLYFGRLEYVKGIHVALQALKILKDQYGIEVPFTIIGSGSELDNLIALKEELGISNVNFIPKVKRSELSLHLNKAIATIIPSTWGETFGLTAIESMVHQTPVIASNIGGLTEIVNHGVDGFLLEPNDQSEFANYIKILLEDCVLAESMGLAGKEKVLKNFSSEAHASKLIEIYKDVINGCSDR